MMTRTMILNEQRECIGYFGDSMKELNLLAFFMHDKTEVRRETEQTHNVRLIKITVN